MRAGCRGAARNRRSARPARLGTGNLYARNLELPLNDNDAMVKAAFIGDDRPVDLGVADIERTDGSESEHAFCVMAGLGLDAKMIKNTNSKLKKAVGWLAYVDGIARSVPASSRCGCTTASRRWLGPHDGAHDHRRQQRCAAGGFLPMPDAKPDDGHPHIAALRPRGPFGWAKVGRKVARENGVQRKSSICRKIIDLSWRRAGCRELPRPRHPVQLETLDMFQLDGDEFGVARSVHAWVDPGSLV